MIWSILGIAFLFLIVVVIGAAALQNLIYICAPNEVLIFSGGDRRVGDRMVRYQIVKGGRKARIPLLERVDRMDLTNMVIDLTASNAYSKGGIPLVVQGVANVKIAGHEPLLNNAIERFLGKTRAEVMQIARATLEGSLRGVLATLTPEEVNGDMILFAEKLVQEVEGDMTSLGLVVDTLKIQSVMDDVKYLDSIGRKKSAEVVSTARIAEAIARADSIVVAAENEQRQAEARINAQIEVAKAEAQRRLVDAQTKRAAVVAEQQATIAAQVARAKAEIPVQTARVEQAKRQLEADVVQPAKAACEAAEAAAKADCASIIQDANARAEALKTLAASWEAAGDSAREMILIQKLEGIVGAISSIIGQTNIEKVTMIDMKAGGMGGETPMPAKLMVANEQLKQVVGIDILDKLRKWEPSTKVAQPVAPNPVYITATPEPAPTSMPAHEPEREKRKKPVDTPPPLIQ